MDRPSTQVVEIATNLDDVTPEVIGSAVETLLAEGALDVWTAPIFMKKNRPGVLLSLLCLARDRQRLALRLIELTGTFGVRYRTWKRITLDRKSAHVQTSLGRVKVKVGLRAGKPVTAKCEWTSVEDLARRTGATPRRILAQAAGATQALLKQGPLKGKPAHGRRNRPSR